MLGALSMIFWALIIVVAVKYVLLIMRADNGGDAVFGLMPLPDIFQFKPPADVEGYCDEEAIASLSAGKGRHPISPG